MLKYKEEKSVFLINRGFELSEAHTSRYPDKDVRI